MTFRIDLHIHSRNSGDNDAEPEEIVEHAVDRGLDGIAFTEHYSFEASDYVERLREQYGSTILLLRGVEFSALEGHCLVFGVNTDRLAIKHAPVQDIIDAVTARGGVVIPTHPFRGGNSLGDLVRSLSGLSGLEGYNGANMHAMNAKAVKTASELGLPVTGGSDAHRPEEVGSCYTEFSEAVTEDSFLDALRSGGFRGVDTRRVYRGPAAF